MSEQTANIGKSASDLRCGQPLSYSFCGCCSLGNATMGSPLAALCILCAGADSHCIRSGTAELRLDAERNDGGRLPLNGMEWRDAGRRIIASPAIWPPRPIAPGLDLQCSGMAARVPFDFGYHGEKPANPDAGRRRIARARAVHLLTTVQ